MGPNLRRNGHDRTKDEYVQRPRGDRPRGDRQQRRGKQSLRQQHKQDENLENIHKEEDTLLHFHKSFGVMQELLDHRDFKELAKDIITCAEQGNLLEPHEGPRFLDLGCAPGGFSACLLQGSVLGPLSAGWGVTLPPNIGGFPMAIVHERLCVQFEDILALQSQDMACPDDSVHICVADAQNLLNFFKQRNACFKYRGMNTKSRSLGIWALTVKECQLAFAKLRPNGSFVFRFGWRGFGSCGNDVHPSGDKVSPELLRKYTQEEEWYKALTHWLFSVLKSLFSVLRPFKSEYVHQADVSFYMVCRNFDRQKYISNDWPAKLDRAFSELAACHDEAALVDGIKNGISDAIKAEIDDLLDYVGRMRAVGIQSRKITNPQQYSDRYQQVEKDGAEKDAEAVDDAQTTTEKSSAPAPSEASTSAETGCASSVSTSQANSCKGPVADAVAETKHSAARSSLQWPHRGPTSRQARNQDGFCDATKGGGRRARSPAHNRHKDDKGRYQYRGDNPDRCWTTPHPDGYQFAPRTALECAGSYAGSFVCQAFQHDEYANAWPISDAVGVDIEHPVDTAWGWDAGCGASPGGAVMADHLAAASIAAEEAWCISGQRMFFSQAPSASSNKNCPHPGASAEFESMGNMLPPVIPSVAPLPVSLLPPAPIPPLTPMPLTPLPGPEVGPPPPGWACVRSPETDFEPASNDGIGSQMDDVVSNYLDVLAVRRAEQKSKPFEVNGDSTLPVAEDVGHPLLKFHLRDAEWESDDAGSKTDKYHRHKKRSGRSVRERHVVRQRRNGSAQAQFFGARSRTGLIASARVAVKRTINDFFTQLQSGTAMMNAMRFALFCAMAWSMNSIIFSVVSLYRLNHNQNTTE